MSTTEYRTLALEGMSHDDLALVVSLQGLANRERPLVYLIPGHGAERHWIDWYRRYGYEPEEASLDELLASFAGLARGCVVFDPAVPDTLNVAISLAGIMDALVCPPSRVDQMRSMGLKVLKDLRGMFSGRVEPYRWLVEKHLGDFDLRLMANCDQGDAVRVWPDMDFVVAHKGLSIGLSINAADYPEEAEIRDRVQTAAPNHALMIGWHSPRDSEATHVYFGSRHSTWVYCGGAWNMSFHQHIPARDGFGQDHCESARCQPGARYATITLSDGDSWHSMCDVQKKFWLNPRRGEVPLGWEVAPIFQQAGPAVLEYYYETRTENDYLMCGPSGMAYNYLSGFADWKGYLQRAAEGMRATSLRTIWNINRVVRHVPGGGIEHTLKDGPIVYTRQQMEEFGGIKDQMGADLVDAEAVARYMKHIPDALGFFQGWERIPNEDPRWVAGKIYCPAASLVRRDIDSVIREFEEAAARQPLPAFVCGHVNCYDADLDSVIETVRRLESAGFTVVRPDTFLRLAQDAHASWLRKE